MWNAVKTPRGPLQTFPVTLKDNPTIDFSALRTICGTSGRTLCSEIFRNGHPSQHNSSDSSRGPNGNGKCTNVFQNILHNLASMCVSRICLSDVQVLWRRLGYHLNPHSQCACNILVITPVYRKIVLLKLIN